MNLLELIHNLSLMIALVAISGFLGQSNKLKYGQRAAIQGFIFGLVAIIGMIYPLQFAEGVIFDGRSVLISLAALFFGPVAAVISVVMTSALRIIQGGSGAIMGVLVIISSAIIGLYFHNKTNEKEKLSTQQLLLIGFIVHVVMVLLMFTLPSEISLTTIKSIAIPVLTIYPLATVFIGSILSNNFERLKFVSKIKQSEEKFKAIFNSIDDGITVRKITPEKLGEYVDINQSFCEMLGYTDEELRNIPRTKFLDPELIKSLDYIIEEIYTSKKVNFKTKHRTKTGEIIPVEIHGSLFRLNNEDHFVGVARDISERIEAENIFKEINAQLEELTSELKESNTDLERFAYIASHDLKEPLRMVSSFSQLLESKYSDILQDEAKEYLKFIVDGATKMQTLIADLLNFSRISTQGNDFELFDTNDLMKDVIKLFSDKLDKMNGIVEFTDLPKIKADESQIRQLFQNLIGNGIKFMNEGVSPLISITAEENKKEWIFHVKDNGIGIEEKNKERIFDMFHKLNSSEKYDGTGIGLAFCKQIVKRHGGKIKVESELGQGSMFTFSIPKA
ncbi:MAG: ATP-binding protein [Candidatus Delongbacteria bacterium]|jgi:PAS domain S-box-containing protein|nr:ATP-binding protein [Candidatus Delongbacteria bacterium]